MSPAIPRGPIKRWWARVCAYLVIVLVTSVISSIWDGDPWIEGLKPGNFLHFAPAVVVVGELAARRERRRAGGSTGQNP
jgi:hypothetical protein